MTGLVTQNFRLHNASQFKEQFSEDSPSNIYIFVGRNRSWTDDNTPPTPTESVNKVEYDLWKNMLALKKITSTDVSNAISRNNWTSGVVYDQYSSETDISELDFYVMTDDYNVYKCMSNNLGATSTVKPTGTSTSIFTTSDGYKWKFMYSISASDALKFITSSYVPCNTLSANNGSTQWSVQQAAANGSVSTVTISAGGTSYKSHVGVLATGGTTTVNLASGADATNDVYVGSSIYISSGTGAGQLRTIVDYVGATKLATVDSAFSPATDATSNYIVSPKVTMTGDGSGFQAYANVASGVVRYVTVTNPGSNYSYANVTISANSSHGSGATVVGHISPKGGHGADAINELYAHTLIMNTKLTGSESGTFFTSNDFRVIGLVADPKLASNGAVATGSTYRMTTKVTVTSPTGTPSADEKFTGGTSGATGYFVERANTTVLYFAGLNGTFTNSETITGATSGATAVVAAKESPSIAKYTGKILYYENRSPVARASDQTEDIKLIVRF